MSKLGVQLFIFLLYKRCNLLISVFMLEHKKKWKMLAFLHFSQLCLMKHGYYIIVKWNLLRCKLPMSSTMLTYPYRRALWILSSWPFGWRNKVHVQPQGDAAAHSLPPAANDGGKSTETTGSASYCVYTITVVQIYYLDCASCNVSIFVLLTFKTRSQQVKWILTY